MAAINFPSSPSVNQVHTEAGISWIWTGTVWNIQSTTSVTALTVTGNYSISTSDDIVFINGAPSSNIIITLPLAANAKPTGVTIKNIGDGTVDITGTSGQTIDGETTISIGVSLTSLYLIPYNNNWYIV